VLAVTELYEFAITPWMANQAGARDPLLLPTCRRARSYLAPSDQTLARLDQKMR